jgi:rhodanese-related sulfurtransferase
MQSFFLILSAIVVIIVFVFLTKKKRGNEMTVAEVQELVIKPQVTILDVRTPQEFEKGHIQGAKLIPVTELNDRITELNPVKGKEILVYCYAGTRSRTACSILGKNGFTVIKNLDGGIAAWIKNGNKIVTE